MKQRKPFIVWAITLTVASGPWLAAQVQTNVPEPVAGAKPVTVEHIKSHVRDQRSLSHQARSGVPRANYSLRSTLTAGKYHQMYGRTQTIPQATAPAC